jgi:DNA polymerase, archaea type
LPGYRHSELVAKLARVVGPAVSGTASARLTSAAHQLFGCDTTSHIVAVEADDAGHARVWRRFDDRVELTEHAFPNWFLTTSLDLLAHLPAKRLSADWLRRAHGGVALDEPLAVVELDTPSGDEDAYRYLVMTNNLREIETTLLETANKRDGDEAHALADLRGLVLAWDPLQQFLTLTGRTFFKDMPFEALRRLQFDLETTGLDEDRDRIFMISMRDSTGWRECLDTSASSEAELVRRFVELVREHDPDTLENHNIFGFDLSFLAKRAARLGVPLSLGRDGSAPILETDVFDGGERPEPFLRWRVFGRQVIDTQHAVRRFGIAAPDMRRHGLKEAARYFGFARTDREYVPGAEIWATYRTDPERVRRYAADDVDEVDGLSRRLLPDLFGLARLLPRSYERIAADTGPGALWELLVVRAYLHAGHAIAAPTPRLQRLATNQRSELFVSGLVGPAVRAVVRPLPPCVLAERSIAPANDHLGVMPRLLQELVAQHDDRSAQMLAEAAHAYLGSPGLFSDPHAAGEAAAIVRHYVQRVVDDVRSRGGTLIEIEGEQVVFGVPPDWSGQTQRVLARTASTYLPAGVQLDFAAHYAGLYTRAPGTSIVLGTDGAVTLIGPAFRAGRLERFGETFMHRAAPWLLSGDVVGLRQVFLETVNLLRTGGVRLEDLCVQVTLHKSPAQYRRGGTHEEPYEVLLAAGVRSWRVGQRIRYFRAHGGEPRLLLEGGDASTLQADTEYYVQRLCSLYCQQFAQAFTRQDFSRVFRLPSGSGPWEVDPTELADVKTIATQLV